jgi:subfamily B ATP-binding cassette protein MsbA
MAGLLPRLYEPQEGRILVDGRDIRDYTQKALRTAIATVAQDSFLFSGTIRDNIRYGRPDATEEEMIAAATAANAHGFITLLPDGYDTVLGERGVNLSGGQRQRISIARAILKDPRILILDEATSALDTASEALVQSALDGLMKNRTSFIIAHRLSTVRNADRILVMDQGRIVEQGTHDELIRKGGLFARLVKQQFGHPEDHTPKAGKVEVAEEKVERSKARDGKLVGV